MSNLTHLAGDYWGVSVPEDAKGFLLTNIQVDTDLIYPNGYGTFNYVCTLPPGQYELIGVSDELTEEECRGIVQKFHNGPYRDYDREYFDPADDQMPFHLSALESFHSLLRSKGLERVVVIKKVK
jgi:hypothetical protein